MRGRRMHRLRHPVSSLPRLMRVGCSPIPRDEGGTRRSSETKEAAGADRTRQLAAFAGVGKIRAGGAVNWGFKAG